MGIQYQSTTAIKRGTVFLWLTTSLFLLVQVHTTLPFGKVGLRIALADLALPLAALGGILYAQTAPRPGYVLRPHLEIAILSLATIWLAFAIALGRAELGYWQSWAVLNRGAGWIVLLAFFACGWMLARCAGYPEQRAVIVFLSFFWFSCFVSAALMILLSYGSFGLSPVPETAASSFEQTVGLVAGTSRFQGFVVNPNAFGFLAATAIAVHLPYIRAGLLLPRRYHILGLGVSLFGLFWSFSRGAWAATVLVGVLLAVFRRLDWRALSAASAVAAALSIALWFSCASSPLPTGSGLTIGPQVFAGGTGTSVSHRQALVEKTLSLWWTSPVAGVGVGTFLDQQSPTPEDPVATIHSTYLWLLAETGAVGLAVFGSFFVFCFVRLLRRGATPVTGAFLVGAAAVLVAYAAVALVMEAMYQRHLWLFLGLALGLAARQVPPAPVRASP